MKSRTRRAFSMSETLMTMGIIGLLAVTMLSMNNFADNKQQIAQTKLTQVDSAIRAWGKAVTQMNETGVGATATISDATTLRASLMNTLNAKSIDPETGVITLDNGAEIKADYTLGDEQARESDSIFATGSALAHIEVSVPNADQNATPLSEDYILQVDKLSSMSDLLEGYTKVTVVEVNGEKRACFDNIAKCDITNEAGIHNCKTNPEQCELIDADLYDGNHIYIKNDTTASGCGINTTGSLITYTYITTNGSMYTYEKSTCCDAPKYFNHTNNMCECVKANMTFVAGEYFEPKSNTCAATAPKGYYAIDGTSYPAMSDGGNIGYYCDETGLSAPKLCPAGYYCPKKSDNVAGATYGGDDIGSLINPVICPKGYYCPEGSQMPKECPAGHYCPTDGLGEPIACPRGTYQPTKGEITACSLCAPIIDGENKIPTYQDEVGQTSCKTCTGAGKFTEKTTGATSCSGCGAGKYYANGTCKPCSAGTYSEGDTDTCTACPAGTVSKAGAKACTPCTCDTYAKNNVCVKIPVGYYSHDVGNQFSRVASGTPLSAANISICPKGYKCPQDGTCGANLTACPAGSYQNQTGQTSCKECTVGHKCPNEAMENPISCEAGTFQPNTAQTACIECDYGYYQNLTGQQSCQKCPAGKHGNNTKGLTACVDCPAGTWSNQEGNTNANDCTWCQPGTYSTAVGATSIGTCEQCPIRTYTVANYTSAPSGSAVCRTCPEGTYSLAEGAVDVIGDGASVCKFCPDGTKYNAENQNSYTTLNNICTKCPQHTYGDPKPEEAPNALTDNYDKSKYPGCENCPFGTAFTGTGATDVSSCVACEAGQQTNPDGTCSSCPAGTYSTTSPDNPNVKICTPCPAGTTTDGGGKTSIDACSPCAQYTHYGKIVNENGQDVAKCFKCAEQTYSETAGATSCTACKDYGDSVYLLTQGHNHKTTLGGLLNMFKCVPRSQITDDQKKIYSPEGRQLLFIISSNGFLIDYISTGSINSVKDGGGSYGKGVMDKTVDQYYYSTQGRKGWIGNNSCNAHGSSVKGGTLKTMGYQCQYNVNYTFKVQSPLVFDIQGDGLVFTSVQDGVQFNITGDKMEQTAWTTNMENKGFDDAFLCIADHGNPTLTYINTSDFDDDNDKGMRRDGHNNIHERSLEAWRNDHSTPIVYNGKVLNVDIKSGKQLFGDQNGEATGFDELIKYDSNGDGFINEQDNIFKNLLLWSDLNKNGRVDYYVIDGVNFVQGLINTWSGKEWNSCTAANKNDECASPEIKTLAEVGIKSISTAYSTEYVEGTQEVKTDEHGNVIGIVGSFLMNLWNSTTEALEEVWNTIVDVFFKTENS